MRFESIAIADAQGAILAHSAKAGGRAFKKGRVLSAADISALRESGIARVTAARLEPGDIGEDEAAARIALALRSPGLRVGAAFSGRANLYAEEHGLVVLDTERIDAANLIDETVTIATLAPFAMVVPGDMVATVKIIPFAAPETVVQKVETTLGNGLPIAMAQFRPLNVALVSTELPGMKQSLLDKNRTALEARLAALSGQIVFEKRCAHDADAIAGALHEAYAARADLLLVFGASAITDRRDVVPAGIQTAGGKIVHFGMPVDPGNLLLLGDMGGRPVVGLPGCARSPKLNGFDFVLQRLLAGVKVESSDIMRMGAGGLLKEIPTRPQPRESNEALPRAARIAGVVLGGGQSRRMGKNKLLAEWRGKKLVRHVVDAAFASHARPIIVVTGHQAEETRAALAGLDVFFVHNPHYAEGLSTSLRAGIGAVPDNCDGALVMLGDMPEITPPLLDKLIAAFSPQDGRAICVATHDGKRGNPVLWSRRYFPDIESVIGDTGAKHLIAASEDAVCEVETQDAAVLIDIDTPDALAALQKRTP